MGGGARLEFPGEDRQVPLNGAPVTLGRAGDCDIVIDHRHVSRRHAELRLQLGRRVVLDLGSLNGVFVNGKRVKQASLSDGDRLTLGSITLVFRS